MAAHSRLNTALTEGLLQLPPGDVHVMRAPGGFDLSAFDGHDVHLSHTFAPDFLAWDRANHAITTQTQSASTMLVVLPRSKAQARSMIAEAAGLADLVIVDGQKTDGVDSLFKAVRKELGDLPSITKAHGRLFWFKGTDAFADWVSPPPSLGDHGFYTTAGVFSDGAIDKGSALLVEALPKTLKGHIADFGAGWGFLSKAILENEAVKSLDLIEAEHLALDCAKLNIDDPRANFIWSDATLHKSAEPYDTIVMNPPFHQGRAGDPSLGQSFISAAAKNLKPSGNLWMVANRHLPYEAHLAEKFRDVSEHPANAAFKIFHASRPKR